MDVRAKIVYLVKNALMAYGKDLEKVVEPYEFIADFLISNGATLQEWISVAERLPNQVENAICINRHGDMMIGTYTKWGWMFPYYFEEPTHWMPLPQPAEEE